MGSYADLDKKLGGWLPSFGDKYGSKPKNLVQMLNRDRDNTGFSLYEDNPEKFDELGEAGVKFKDSPRWLSWIHQNRPFTFGNTVFSPENYGGQDYFEGGWGRSDEDLLNVRNKQEGGEDYGSWGDFIAGEETPHVAQYRDEGLFGFLGKHGMQLAHHGGGGNLYQAEDTHESFHYRPDEKNALYSQVLDPHAGHNH